MKEYGKIAAEGMALVATPFLFLGIVCIVAATAPFFLIGLLKRGIVAAFTAGDPLVP